MNGWMNECVYYVIWERRRRNCMGRRWKSNVLYCIIWSKEVYGQKTSHIYACHIIYYEALALSRSVLLTYTYIISVWVWVSLVFLLLPLMLLLLLCSPKNIHIMNIKRRFCVMINFHVIKLAKGRRKNICEWIHATPHIVVCRVNLCASHSCFVLFRFVFLRRFSSFHTHICQSFTVCVRSTAHLY